MIDFFLLAVLVISVITDIRGRKILNKVTYPAILIGLIFNTATDGLHGLIFSGEGFLAGIGLLIIPFVMGGVGAGDVKLLGAVGAMKGAAFVFYGFLYGALIGGLLALFIILKQKRAKDSAKNLYYALSLLSGNKGSLQVIDKTDLAPSFPYGVPLALGTIMVYLMGGVL